MTNFADPMYIMLGAVGFMIVFLLVQFGIIKIRSNVSITEHKAGFNKPTWVDPTHGILTIEGSREVAGKLLPRTHEYGKDRYLPIARKPMVDMFPVNINKLASGDPDGNVWMVLDEKNPYMQAIKLQMDALNYVNTLLTLRVHGLENENLQMRSEMEEFIKRQAEWMGDVKKKIGTSFIPSDRFARSQMMMGGQGD